MSAPDELAEMKLWTPCLHDMWRATETDPQLLDASKLYYARDEVDRVIAARDATIQMLNGDMVSLRAQWNKCAADYTSLREALASRDAEIGRLREALGKAQRRLGALRGYVPVHMHAPYLLDLNEIDSALTPPSQAPEARRDVGGEKL